MSDLAGRLRAICLGLPEVTERPSHGAPTWFVRGKSSFVTLWADGHHDNQFPQLWCAAPPGAQQELTASDPERFFRPSYVGGRGWIGVRLDRDADWAEIAELCQDAYRVIAPASLAVRHGRLGSESSIRTRGPACRVPQCTQAPQSAQVPSNRAARVPREPRQCHIVVVLTTAMSHHRGSAFLGRGAAVTGVLAEARADAGAGAGSQLGRASPA